MPRAKRGRLTILEISKKVDNTFLDISSTKTASAMWRARCAVCKRTGVFSVYANLSSSAESLQRYSSVHLCCNSCTGRRPNDLCLDLDTTLLLVFETQQMVKKGPRPPEHFLRRRHFQFTTQACGQCGTLSTKQLGGAKPRLSVQPRQQSRIRNTIF